MHYISHLKYNIPVVLFSHPGRIILSLAFLYECILQALQYTILFKNVTYYNFRQLLKNDEHIIKMMISKLADISFLSATQYIQFYMKLR